jgi:hypothetical protein
MGYSQIKMGYSKNKSDENCYFLDHIQGDKNFSQEIVYNNLGL